MKLILCCLILVALVTSKGTIPELYNLNKGSFTSDYSVTYTNPAVSGEFGVVAEAGDINNDGIQDFMISDPLYDNGKGIVYVVYGKPGSLRQFDSMEDFQPSDGFIVKGKANMQKLGFSVSHAGDVNGDGIDDIIIGSELWNQDDYTTEVGMVNVVFGRRHGDFPSILDVDLLPPTQGFKVFGEGAMNYLGVSVSGAGDVNGDGISDILLGAFGAGDGGKAYVIFGSKEGLKDMKLPPEAGKGFTVEGSNQEHLANSVSKVGDFNGDGVDDIIIGAHVADQWRGRAYIIYGKREGLPTIIRAPPSANDGMMLEGVAGGDNFGCAVSGIGDFNGDGLQDVIIGAYAANGGRGSAYLVLGNRQNPGVLRISSLSPSRGFNIISNENTQLGMIVSGGRDLNGDGLSDAIVTAPGLSQDRGAVAVIYGYQQSSFSQVILDFGLESTQGYVLYGTAEGGRFGSFVRPLKDVNNDGVNDLAVGAFVANGGKGTAYLFYLPCKSLFEKFIDFFSRGMPRKLL